jgi:hypothetical protein
MRFLKNDKFHSLKENQSLILILLILSILIGIYGLFSSDKTYVLTTGKSAETPEMETFCRAFIEQILNKSLHQEMVEGDIYSVLTENNYSVLGLVGSEELLFSRSKENQCSVILRDKLGLRRFDLWVNKSFDYPFYYRIQKIDEPKIEG